VVSWAKRGVAKRLATQIALKKFIDFLSVVFKIHFGN
jgi:hypothetical protein